MLNSPLTFIDGLVGLLVPLLALVPLVIVSHGGDVDALVASIEAHRVSRVTVVPSLLSAMLTTVDDIGQRVQVMRSATRDVFVCKYILYSLCS